MIKSSISNDFSISNILLEPDDPRSAYAQRPGKKGYYWGQRKLLMGEVYFLSQFVLNKYPSPIVVYAGAAEGTHFLVLARIFPQVRFELYDPRKFNLRLNELTNVTIHREFFTDITAEYWSSKNRDESRNESDWIYFISDIRTADYTQLSAKQTEEQVLFDMRAQERWYYIIQPKAAFMKFRLPYSDKDVETKINYLSGAVLLQPWAPLSSSETRLMPYSYLDPYQMIDRQIWDGSIYEDQLFHHNLNIRELSTWSKYALDPPELNGSWDASAEIYIWTFYLTKTLAAIQKFPTINDVIELSRWTNEQLGGTIAEHYVDRSK